MNIDKFIEDKAPNKTLEHDKAYAAALMYMYSVYSLKSVKELTIALSAAREQYRLNGNTHDNTARTVIIHNLLEEKKNAC